VPRLRAARFAVIPLALCAMLVLAVSSAAAVKYPTTVSVSFKFPAFHGTLKSPKASCKAGRTVRLYKVKSGPDKLLKQGTSDAKGRWSTLIGKPVPAGSYYVKATHKGNCKAGKSGVIPVA